MGCLETALPLSPQASPFPLPAWPNPVWISFPLRTCSRSDVSLLSCWIHGYHPLSLSLAPLPLLPIFNLRGLFQTIVLFCSVLSLFPLTFSIIPLFLYFFSITHCLCEALSWPNAWLRPLWLKVAQGMARLMFSFFYKEWFEFFAFHQFRCISVTFFSHLDGGVRQMWLLVLIQPKLFQIGSLTTDRVQFIDCSLKMSSIRSLFYVEGLSYAFSLLSFHYIGKSCSFASVYQDKLCFDLTFM